MSVSASTVRGPTYRIPPSKYWAQYWYSRQVGAIASLQLVATFGTISMEIGNAVVDIFRSNIYAGFWSFPFMVVTILVTYACVCATRTQTKAIVALICQLISIIILLIASGFLIAFIATDFTLCLGIQCSQPSSTIFSSSDYFKLKQAFISCELACSILFIILSIFYIFYFIKCYKKLPRIHPIVRTERTVTQSTLGIRQLSTMSKVSRPWSMSTTSHNHHHRRVATTEHIRISSTATTTAIQSTAEKICPICKHVSPYIPGDDIIVCPNCGYKSPLVEHAQQC